MAACKEVVFAANGDGADGVFCEVVVDLQLAVLEITGDVVEAAEEVIDRLTHG